MRRRRAIALTGSIGMGKSTAAAMLGRLGVPVYDADRAVHAVMGRGGAAVVAIEATFPGVVRDGAVDRAALGACVFGDRAALARLEAIVHPLVRQAEQRFLRRAAACRKPLVALDIPRLFETGSRRRYDAAVVVSAPPFVQAARVRARAGMTCEKFDAILTRQMADTEKRRRADFVVPTGLGPRFTLRRLKRIVTLMGGAGARRRLRGSEIA